jgi:hypothetical protein
MSDRNVPVTEGTANDRELTRLMAGLPGMVYRASAQSPFVFETVGGGYERIFGRSDMTWRGLQRLSPGSAPLE